MSTSFTVSYLVPLALASGTAFVLIKAFRKEYITHFYVFLFVLAMYLTSNWTHIANPSAFNHYVLLSDAFLHGRFHLAFDPGFHDVSFYDNRFFISQPPLPAILMLPFVLVYGITFNDIVFTIVLGAVNSAIVYDILVKLSGESKKPIVKKSNALFLTSFFAFGTVAWSIAIQGQVWHTAHIVALFFLLLAIREIFGKKRFFIAGLFASTAIAARPSVFWAFLFFIVIGIKESLDDGDMKRFFIRMGRFVIPYLAWAVLLGLFNYARFGNPLEFGFAYMNHAAYLKERLDAFGTLHPHYFMENLSVAFTSFFTIKNTPPYLIPPPEGMSMFVTSPLLIYAVRAFPKGSFTLTLIKDARAFFSENHIVIGAILASLCTAIPLLLYFNTGWIQFGYRYILDYLPFLVILLAYGMRGKIGILSTMLLVLSCCMILYGILIYLYYPEVI